MDVLKICLFRKSILYVLKKKFGKRKKHGNKSRKTRLTYHEKLDGSSMIENVQGHVDVSSSKKQRRCCWRWANELWRDLHGLWKPTNGVRYRRNIGCKFAWPGTEDGLPNKRLIHIRIFLRTRSPLPEGHWVTAWANTIMRARYFRFSVCFYAKRLFKINSVPIGSVCLFCC